MTVDQQTIGWMTLSSSNITCIKWQFPQWQFTQIPSSYDSATRRRVIGALSVGKLSLGRSWCTSVFSSSIPLLPCQKSQRITKTNLKIEFQDECFKGNLLLTFVRRAYTHRKPWCTLAPGFKNRPECFVVTAKSEQHWQALTKCCSHFKALPCPSWPLHLLSLYKLAGGSTGYWLKWSSFHLG